jgi:hypothetical protein
MKIHTTEALGGIPARTEALDCAAPTNTPKENSMVTSVPDTIELSETSITMIAAPAPSPAAPLALHEIPATNLAPCTTNNEALDL